MRDDGNIDNREKPTLASCDKLSNKIKRQVYQRERALPYQIEEVDDIYQLAGRF